MEIASWVKNGKDKRETDNFLDCFRLNETERNAGGNFNKAAGESKWGIGDLHNSVKRKWRRAGRKKGMGGDKRRLGQKV